MEREKIKIQDVKSLKDVIAYYISSFELGYFLAKRKQISMVEVSWDIIEEVLKAGINWENMIMKPGFGFSLARFVNRFSRQGNKEYVSPWAVAVYVYQATPESEQQLKVDLIDISTITHPVVVRHKNLKNQFTLKHLPLAEISIDRYRYKASNSFGNATYSGEKTTVFPLMIRNK